MPTSIAIADDHYLVAAALSDLVQKFDNYEVLFVAGHGRDLLNHIGRGLLPDIALVDISMPEMDGFETAAQLRELHPTVRVIALSMTGYEDQIVRMLRNGARGYLLKGCRPAELRKAFDEVMTKGFYYSDFLTHQLIQSLNAPETSGPATRFNLNNREYDFLKLACSDQELIYEQIADRMCVSPRTVDGYRESVFQKMGVKTRGGMMLKAVKHGLVEL